MWWVNFLFYIIILIFILLIIIIFITHYYINTHVPIPNLGFGVDASRLKILLPPKKNHIVDLKNKNKTCC